MGNETDHRGSAASPWVDVDDLGHERDKRYVSLVLRGAFDPAAISALTGINADRSAREDELVHPQGTLRRRKDYWEVSSGLGTQAEVHDQLDALTQRVRHASPVLADLGRQFELTVNIGVYCHEAQGPLILITPEHARTVEAIGEAVSVEVYFTA